MNNLTTEQLGRIFGERIGQDVKFTNQIFTHTFELKGVRIGDEDVLLNDNVNDEMYASFCKLLLTPLEKISDENFSDLCKIVGLKSRNMIIRREKEYIVGIRGNRYLKLFLKKCDLYIVDYDEILQLDNNYVLHNAISFLIQRGYDVPMFFGMGHPDNGKTLIELGVAIDRTTL